MADETLKQKIRELLRHGAFNDPDDYVLVSDGADDNIHIVIVSPQFEGRRVLEREDMIWNELLGNLAPEEWGQISLSIGHSPEELKAFT